MPEIDISELASLFAAKRAADVKLKTTDSSSGAKRSGGSKGGPETRGVLPMERVKNVGIFLKPLKLSKLEIKRAIARADGDVLTEEIVDGLQKVLPTTKELDLLRREEKKGAALSEEETFMLDVAGVSSCRIRLAAVASRQRFEVTKADVTRALPRLMRAANQLKSCTLLQRILGIVLQVGNAMNAGQQNGSAKAFALDTLHCLKGVRPTQKPDPQRHTSVRTLLHFVAAECCKVGGYERKRCMLADKLNEVLAMVKFNVECVASGPGMLRNCLQQIDEGLTHVAEAAGVDLSALDTQRAGRSIGPDASSSTAACVAERTGSCNDDAVGGQAGGEEGEEKRVVEELLAELLEELLGQNVDEEVEEEPIDVTDTKKYLTSMRDFVNESRVSLDALNAETATTDAACADCVTFLGRESQSGFKDFVALCITLSTFIFDYDGAVDEILRERDMRSRRNSAHAVGLNFRRRAPSVSVRRSPSAQSLVLGTSGNRAGSSLLLMAQGIAEEEDEETTHRVDARDASIGGVALPPPPRGELPSGGVDGDAMTSTSSPRRPTHTRSKSLSSVPGKISDLCDELLSMEPEPRLAVVPESPITSPGASSPSDAS